MINSVHLLEDHGGVCEGLRLSSSRIDIVALRNRKSGATGNTGRYAISAVGKRSKHKRIHEENHRAIRKMAGSLSEGNLTGAPVLKFRYAKRESFMNSKKIIGVMLDPARQQFKHHRYQRYIDWFVRRGFHVPKEYDYLVFR